MVKKKIILQWLPLRLFQLKVEGLTASKVNIVERLDTQHNVTLRITLNRTFTYQEHLETLRKKLASRVALIHRLAGTGWGARETTLRITTLTLVYSTAEYCAPVWRRSALTRLLDRPINDDMRMVTGCLKPTTTEYLPVLSGVPLAELRRKATTLSLARQFLEPGHTFYNYFKRAMTKRRVKSRKLFVIEAQGLLAQNTNAPTWIHNTWKENWQKTAHVFTLSVPMQDHN